MERHKFSGPLLNSVMFSNLTKMKFTVLLFLAWIATVASVGNRTWGDRFEVDWKTYDYIICSENIVIDPVEGKSIHKSFPCLFKTVSLFSKCQIFYEAFL